MTPDAELIAHAVAAALGGEIAPWPEDSPAARLAEIERTKGFVTEEDVIACQPIWGLIRELGVDDALALIEAGWTTP